MAYTTDADGNLGWEDDGSGYDWSTINTGDSGFGSSPALPALPAPYDSHRTDDIDSADFVSPIDDPYADYVGSSGGDRHTGAGVQQIGRLDLVF